ncbi:DNA-directed RNA polymerase subunit beta [Lactococcus lactis]|nr:DNA-directed RNA polymerase subunit beta [Lactococcus lactis]
MTWEGYNFEDAVIMSERLIKDERFIINRNEERIETRDTKLGPSGIAHNAKFQTLGMKH